MQSFWLGSMLPYKNADAEEERGNCGQASQEGNTGWDVLSAESPVCGGECSPKTEPMTQRVRAHMEFKK